MELIVGENTYVTIDEATAYIEENYSERDILRVHWTVCPEEYKTMYLLRALEEIEALPFVGRKTIFTNKLQFPRTLENAPLYVMRSPIYLTYNYDSFKIPPQVKCAQIEDAIDGFIRASYRPTKRAMVLNALGLVPEDQARTGKLSSQKAERYLKPFLGTLKA